MPRTQNLGQAQKLARTYRYASGRILTMSGTLYVQGYRLGEGSLLKERPTTFSLHRIAAINPTGEFFSFDAADTEASRFGLNWHSPKRIHIHIDPRAADYVRDRIWSDDQTIEELGDGGIELAVTTTSEKELNAWWSGISAARSRVCSRLPALKNLPLTQCKFLIGKVAVLPQLRQLH